MIVPMRYYVALRTLWVLEKAKDGESTGLLERPVFGQSRRAKRYVRHPAKFQILEGVFWLLRDTRKAIFKGQGL